MEAFISFISTYFPEKSLNNEDLSLLFPEWSAEKIEAKTGVFNRHESADDEFSTDMAVKVGEKLFAEYDVSPSQIDFVLLCTQSPDYFLPTSACIIQDKLGIPNRAGAFDFNLGCSGFVYGLAIAKGFITAGIANNVLLITSETYTKFIHESDRGNRTIFGDGAAATIISSKKGFAKIGDFVLGTDGNGAENLIVKRGGIRYQKTNDILLKNENHLHMNGPEIFNFTSKMVPIMIDELMQKVDLKSDEIRMFILHQANEFMLNHIRKKIDIPISRFYNNLRDCGNTVSSTIPIALKDVMKGEDIKRNDKLLLAGFGVGYSWASTIITIQ